MNQTHQHKHSESPPPRANRETGAGGGGLPCVPTTNASMSTTAAARAHGLPILPASDQCVNSACCKNEMLGRPVLDSLAEAFLSCGENASCPRRRLPSRGEGPAGLGGGTHVIGLHVSSSDRKVCACAAGLCASTGRMVSDRDVSV